MALKELCRVVSVVSFFRLCSRGEGHQPRRPPLHFVTRTTPNTQEPSLLRPPKSISLTINPSIHLKIIIPEHPLTIRTSQASRMELLFPLALKILAFDTFIAVIADGAVEFVVMAFAVGGIVYDVEG